MELLKQTALDKIRKWSKPISQFRKILKVPGLCKTWTVENFFGFMELVKMNEIPNGSDGSGENVPNLPNGSEQ